MAESGSVHGSFVSQDGVLAASTPLRTEKKGRRRERRVFVPDSREQRNTCASSRIYLELLNKMLMFAPTRVQMYAWICKRSDL